MSEDRREKSREEMHTKILQALEKPPIYEGFTVKKLSNEIKMPQPTARWHLEILEASGKVESFTIGKTKLFKLSNKRKN